MNRICCAALLGAASVLVPYSFGVAADSRNGLSVAERWCAGCHVVSQGQTTGTTDAPPFSEIAQRGHMNAAQVALFLLGPHPPMSGLSLSRNEAADLAAYIASQGAVVR